MYQATNKLLNSKLKKKFIGSFLKGSLEMKESINRTR